MHRFLSFHVRVRIHRLGPQSTQGVSRRDMPPGKGVTCEGLDLEPRLAFPTIFRQLILYTSGLKWKVEMAKVKQQKSDATVIGKVCDYLTLGSCGAC